MGVTQITFIKIIYLFELTIQPTPEYTGKQWKKTLEVKMPKHWSFTWLLIILLMGVLFLFVPIIIHHNLNQEVLALVNDYDLY